MARSSAVVTRTALAACIIAGLAPATAAAQDPTPAMEYRQTIMGSLNAHRGALAAILNEDVPHEAHVLGHALSLQQLSVMASDIFPEGSHGEGSRALPDIWNDAAGFGEALSAFQSAAEAFSNCRAFYCDSVTYGIRRSRSRCLVPAVWIIGRQPRGGGCPEPS